LIPEWLEFLLHFELRLNRLNLGKSLTIAIFHFSLPTLKLTMARQTRGSATSTPQTAKSTPKRSPRNSANKKSKYFESASEQEDSSFDEDDATADLDSESEAPATETEEDEPPKKKSKTTPKKGVSKVPPKKTVSRGRLSKKDEVESDEEPWETFVPKEDTPEVGDVPYKNHTIHPNTLKFLEGMSWCFLRLNARFVGE
jgi:hypothetical protein